MIDEKEEKSPPPSVDIEKINNGYLVTVYDGSRYSESSKTYCKAMVDAFAIITDALGTK